MMDISQKLRAFVHEHGRVTSCEIERELGVSGETVRSVVSNLRCDGVPIGSDRQGYYWATCPAELDRTIEHLQKRRNRLSAVIQSLEATKSTLAWRVVTQGVV